MKRRIFSMLLAVLMMFTAVDISAFAKQAEVATEVDIVEDETGTEVETETKVETTSVEETVSGTEIIPTEEETSGTKAIEEDIVATEEKEYVQSQILSSAMENIEIAAASSNDTISQEAINKLFFEHPEYLVNEDFDDVISETLKYSLKVQEEIDNEKIAAYIEALHQGSSILWSEFWSWLGIGESYQEQHEKEMAKEILQKYSDSNDSLMTSTNEVKSAIGTMSKVYDITLASERELLANELKSKHLAMSDEKIDKIVKECFADAEYLSLMKKVSNEAIGTFVISMEYIELLEIEERAINDLIAISEQSGCEDVEAQLKKIKKDRDTDFWTYFSKYYLTEHTLEILWDALKDWVKDNANVTKINMKEISSAQKVAGLMLKVVADMYSEYNPNVDEMIFSAMALSYFSSAEIVLNNYETKFLLAKKGQGTVTEEDIRMYEAAYAYQLSAIQILAKYCWKITYKQDQSSELSFHMICSKNAVDKLSYSKYLKSCLKNMEEDNIVVPELPEDYDSTESIAAKFEVIRNQFVPNASYWTGSWGGCIQCFGFARMVFSKLFGCEMPSAYYGNRRYELVPSSNVVLIGQLVGSNVNSTNVKNLLTQGKLGDVIQANGVYGQHTMVLEGTSDTGVTVYHCNKNGDCGVYEDTYSWNNFAYLYGSATNGSDNGISLYRAHNYATIYGDGTNLFYDDTVNFVIDENGVLTKYNGWQKFVKIPDTVTAIGANAFMNNTSMMSVSIPEGVNTIGANAFRGCSNLIGVYIPDRVTDIGAQAFSGCTSLEEVVLSKKLITIGSDAFYNCDALTSIEIPKSLEECPGYYGPFDSCDSLKTITFEQGVTRVAPYLFAGCTGLERIEIPNTVTSINTDAFRDCTKLKEVIIPNSVTKIGADAFMGSGIEEITIPNSVTQIGNSAFKNCVHIKRIVLPDSIKQLEAQAFSGCTSLEEVVLSKKLITIGSDAFYNCDALTSIEIPKSLEECPGYYGPFDSCDSLKTITFEQGVTRVAPYLFAGCTGLERIEIPNTVTSINTDAFRDCTKLKEIEISEGLITLEGEAFRNCTSLKEISIPNTVTSMGTNVFYNCTSLESVHLPNIRQNIMAYSFYNCTSLKEVNFPDTLISVQNYAFYNCDALQTVDLPDKVTTIGQYAFYDCDGLTTVNMKDAVTSIGNYAFNGCDLLENVTLSAGITAIPQYGFSNCGSLEEIVLPYKTTSIQANAFANDVNLKKITIPRNVTSIASNAFSYPANMIIYGVSGTYAETFAEANNITFVNQEIHASAIEVFPENPTVNKGYTKQMTLSVTPANFTDEIVWKSSDTSIVTVDQNGLIKGVGIGNTKVKVVVGDVSKQVTVTVLQPVTSVYVSPSSANLEAGQEVKLSADIYPDNASNKDYEWSSENESVATVDSEGKVTGISKGTVKIYAKAKDGSEEYDYCNVTVTSNLHIVNSVEDFESKHPYDNNCTDVWKYQNDEAKKIAIRFSDETEVEEDFDFIYIYGDKDELIGKYTGTELAGKEITVSGTSVRVKLVSDNAGTAYGFKVVELRPIGAEQPLESISLSEAELTLQKGNQKQLIVNYYPENTTDSRMVEWSSSDSYVATVDSEGVVKAIGAGTATVQAKVGKCTAKCTVTVTAPLESIEFEVEEIELAIGDRYTVDVQYNPSDTTDDRVLLWTSSNTSVATVNNNGVVSVIGYGETVIEGVSAVDEKIKDTYTVKVNKYEVQFDSMGGSSIEPVLCGYKQTLDCSEIIPVRENYIFQGWYKDRDCQELWTNSDIVTSNITLYAKWQEVKDGLWVMPIEDQIYTGKDIKPIVRVYDGETLLTNKVDYTVSYKNCKKANDASDPKNAPTITVKGKGNYSGKETVTFKILKKDISDIDITVENITVNYNKKTQKKVPTVVREGKKLKNKTDFIVSYPDLENNPNAYKEQGEYTILVKGNGGYEGEREVKMTITDSVLMSKVSVSKIGTQLYTGASITTSNMTKPPVVKYGKSTVLKEGIHYNVDYENNVNIGTATMILNGTDIETPEGTFTGTKKITFKITGTSLKNAKVTGIPKSMVYTGQEINEQTEGWMEPIKVVLKDKELVRAMDEQSEGDYVLIFNKNINKGTATVTVKGINAYSGSVNKKFTISAYDINDNEGYNLVTESMETNAIYAKGGSKPEPVVKFGEIVLVKGKDYTLSYANNTKLHDGTSESKIPTVTIKGKGNFKGSVKLTYTIAKQDISKLDLTVADVVYKNAKGAYKGKPVIKDLDNKTLKQNTDYVISEYIYGQDVVLEDGTEKKENDIVGATDIVPAGTILRVTVTGKGNYADSSITGEYRITKLSITKASVKVASQTYTGKEIKPDKSQITVKIGKQVLTADDYDIVSYSNNIKKGTAKVTIKGKGNYGGTKTVNFTIKSKGFLWWWR